MAERNNQGTIGPRITVVIVLGLALLSVTFGVASVNETSETNNTWEGFLEYYENLMGIDSLYGNETLNGTTNIAQNQTINQTINQTSSNITTDEIISSDFEFGAQAISAGWAQKAKLTVNSSQVDADLTDFPVLLTETSLPAQMFATVNGSRSDGCDLRFTTDLDGTTELPFELVSIDKTSDTAEIWIKLDLSSTVDTEFYVWWNNSVASCYAETDTYGSHNVWTNNYTAVWHLEEDFNNAADGYADSTSNGHDGTGVSMSADADGQIGNSQVFDGTADYITLPLAAASGYQGTISAWIRPDVITGSNPILSSTDKDTLGYVTSALQNTQRLVAFQNNNNANNDYVMSANLITTNMT